MKAKDIIKYESENEDTILLILNKSVCRVFEVSAFWLSRCIRVDKLYNKYSRGLDTRMIYAWFTVRRLNKVLEELQAAGFRPTVRTEEHIILKKEGATPEGYDEWKEQVYNGAILEKHAYDMEYV